MGLGHYINGAFRAPTGKEAFASSDPIYGHTLWEGASATEEEVNCAVAAARDAFPAWSLLSFEERHGHCQAFLELLESHTHAFTTLIAKETGKVLWEAETEVQGMKAKLQASVNAYTKRTGETAQTLGDARSILRHRPHGVVAVYGPFNFPGHLPNGHIIPALLAGNTIVFKPSEQTPAVGELIIKLWHEAGLPRGVINLVQGEASTGKVLSEHPDLNGLFFTGSARVGALLHKAFAGHPEKILALELGGNNPLIAWDVNDLKATAYSIIQSAFITAGQRCVCARRLILPMGEEGDQLLSTLIDMSTQLSVGPYDQSPEPFYSGLISQAAKTSCLEAIEALITQGAVPLLKGSCLDPNTTLLSPTILDVTGLKNREDEEMFGPILQVIRVNDFDDAIVEANRTRYGLSAGLLSDSQARYDTFLPRARAGIVNWNRQITGASGANPFGGIGISGNHRPSAAYAADYCAYPVASIECDSITLPDTLTPGISLDV